MKKNTCLSAILVLAATFLTSQAQAKMLYGKVGAGVGLSGNLNGNVESSIPELPSGEGDLGLERDSLF